MNISVVLATYNGVKYLDAQLQSLFAQTLQPQEIIVCDDRSTDNTADILKKYADQGRLAYVVNETQQGVIRNFKKAVSLASLGNFVALCDQDDIWLPQKLEQGAATLTAINVADKPCISYSDLILIDDDDHIISPSFRAMFGHNRYTHCLETDVYTNLVTGCTILMNDAAKKMFLNMPDDVRSHDEWLALIAFTFGQAANITEPLVKYRKHDANVSLPRNFKPQSSFQRLNDKLKNLVGGEHDFLTQQLAVIDKFFAFYGSEMAPDKKKIFEDFLKLKDKNIYSRKWNYQKTMRKYRL